MSITSNLPPPRSILLVGGGQGIGLESTLYLLANSPSSIHLIVFGLDINDQLRRHRDTHNRLHLLQGDVTKSADRERAIQLCLDVAGALDCLVYCAGLITPIQRIENLDLDAVRLTYEVNVFGVIAMCQLALPHLLRSRRPHAIILSSACDFSVTYRGWMTYCTTKAALSRFIQLFAHENPELCVQGVYPRLTDTKMPADVVAGKYAGIMAEAEIQRFRDFAKDSSTFEPAAWCGEAVARLAYGSQMGGNTGKVLYYEEHVPDLVAKKPRARL
ncbi:hypothetical protein PV10_00669 [Exophiala mesophila]|uniref:Ketoreductase (KR) domain-containing protein n=1 Tax=Exophiala mesophila TaxID=212818 RepID=A0A0D2AD56_EXOME|nr:uncharacterized protein PV10_00669 [Exophiala mesophila]KIV96853.1 hypothetical protein PV10_00669 [Exophiala mesophila]